MPTPNAPNDAGGALLFPPQLSFLVRPPGGLNARTGSFFGTRRQEPSTKARHTQEHAFLGGRLADNAVGHATEARQDLVRLLDIGAAVVGFNLRGGKHAWMIVVNNPADSGAVLEGRYKIRHGAAKAEAQNTSPEKQTVRVVQDVIV